MAHPVARIDDVEPQSFPWGGIKWLMNQEADAEAEQTFGLVYINAGQENPPHYHPNCEEILYVLSGRCVHTYGDDKYELGPGDMIRVPSGVVHHAVTKGWEPVRAIISFSAGARATVFLEGEK